MSLNVPDATVAWNDIGGLRQVKDTLLEVIEWPTKVGSGQQAERRLSDQCIT